TARAQGHLPARTRQTPGRRDDQPGDIRTGKRTIWGNGSCPRGDLNTETGEISPDRGNHAIRVTGAGRTHPAIPRRVRCLVRHLGPRSSPPWSAGPTPTWRRSRPPARITTRSAARAPHDRSLGGELFGSGGAGDCTARP